MGYTQEENLTDTQRLKKIQIMTDAIRCGYTEEQAFRMWEKVKIFNGWK